MIFVNGDPKPYIHTLNKATSELHQSGSCPIDRDILSFLRTHLIHFVFECDIAQQSIQLLIRKGLQCNRDQ